MLREPRSLRLRAVSPTRPSSAAAHQRPIPQVGFAAARALRIYRQSKPLVMAAPFRECPPDRSINRLRAGAAVIKAYTVNGRTDAWVEPRASLVLAWTVVNAESIVISRGGAPGPLPGVLRMLGVEVTQGIQFFGGPEADNSIPLVARKDTVVRAHVAAEGLDGFKWDVVNAGQVRISGELKIDGMTLMPENGASALALRTDLRKRQKTDHTLNFRLPAATAVGTKQVRVRAWSADELPTTPAGEVTRPHTPYRTQDVHWFDRKPFKVRYVRVSENDTPALTDAAARDLLVRAFDLLATPLTATRRSERMLLPARPVDLRIVSPRDDEVLLPDRPFSLAAQAADSWGRSLPAGCLEWLVDGITVARGDAMALATGLQAGLHTITLRLTRERAEPIVVHKEITVGERSDEYTRGQSARRSLEGL